MFTIFLISSLFIVQQSFGEESLDFENCKDVLTIDEVQNVIGNIDDITVDSRGVLPVDSESGLMTMCISTFESTGGTISMNLVVMDSADNAVALYEKNIDSMTVQEFEIREYLTFWNNFDVVLNDQGLGSFMVSQYDKFFINFHTTIDENKTSMADIEQLRVLSTIVQKKILDLDDVSISPPNPLHDNDIGPTTDEPPISPPSTPPIDEGMLLSPKKQVSQGIQPAAVKCKEGLSLVLKYSNESPACVKPSTVEILYERGWGEIPPPCCKPTTISKATNFEECVAEGNPVMESYPRQCRTIDGKHFVEALSEKEQCRTSGGLWGIWGNAVESTEQCNPPTTDAGKQCTDTSQCQSYCQAKDGSEINSENSGTCYGHELAICMQEVRNGIVEPEWCQ
ncbi:MAG: hypothetical protein OEY54_02280 [Nitrosopumilus sp.]|nr:hypothetical protein [Nitrosopumilus sp.]